MGTDGDDLPPSCQSRRGKTGRHRAAPLRSWPLGRRSGRVARAPYPPLRPSLIVALADGLDNGFAAPVHPAGRAAVRAALLLFRAATLDNATALGLSHELGSIEVGKRADLLLLKDNPLANVSAYDSIETVFLNGEAIARQALRPQG